VSEHRAGGGSFYGLQEMTAMSIRTALRRTSLFLAGTLCAFSGAALAHHSFAMFDQSKHIQIQGVVQDYQWTQPHVWLDLMVVGKQGGEPVRWGIEAQSPGILFRRGWKPDSIKPGDKVVADIFPMKDGSAGGQMLRVTLPDGRVITTSMSENVTY
jgi:hypothetical protein